MLPLLVNVSDKKVLVVGYGKVGRRKAQQFRDQGAKIWVYDYGLVVEASAEGLQIFQQNPLEVADLSAFSFVVVATNDPDYNEAVMAHCQGQGIWCNRADSPDDNDFHTMATVWRGDLGVSVTTQGAVPGFAKAIKSSIEAWLPDDTGLFLDSLKLERQQAIGLEEPQKSEQLARIEKRIKDWLMGIDEVQQDERNAETSAGIAVTINASDNVIRVNRQKRSRSNEQ